MYNEALCVASVQRAILVIMRVAIVVQQPTSDLHRSSSGEILFQIDNVLCLNIEISKLIYLIFMVLQCGVHRYYCLYRQLRSDML
jgi:hypothetical protein